MASLSASTHSLSYDLYSSPLLMASAHGLYSWPLLMASTHGLYPWLLLMASLKPSAQGLYSWPHFVPLLMASLMTSTHGL